MKDITENELESLNNISSLYLLHQEPLFRKHFIEYYLKRGIPFMLFDLFQVKPSIQQIEILNTFSFIGGRLVIPSGHGIGKTHIIGSLSISFLLLFTESICRVQAPTLAQITSLTFKEATQRVISLRNHKRWGFIANFIEIQTKKIFIKQYKTSWYIEPKTAPVGNPVNLAGQHNRFYLLIFEEMTGIPDEHIKVSMGALTEKFNSCIGFSQWTTRNHMFNECCTTNSKPAGGIWTVKPQSSEDSPLVTKEAIQSWRKTYTKSEFRVKCLGMPPLDEQGVLFGYKDIEQVLFHSKINKDVYYHTLVVSTDVAYTGVRDSGVTTVCLIGTLEDETIPYVNVIELNVFDGVERPGLKPVEHAKEALHILRVWVRKMIKSNIPIKKVEYLIDATSGGREAYTTIQDDISAMELAVGCHGIVWGSKRLFGLDKTRFVSNKAKAFFFLKFAIEEDKFCLSIDDEWYDRIKKEMNSTKYSTTKEDMRYRIEEHEDSPDILDSWVQIYLIRYEYFDADGVSNLIELDEIQEMQRIDKDDDDSMSVEIVC